MIWRQQKWFAWSEVFLSWLVLLTLIFYTYVELVEGPYIGFNFNSTTGRVGSVFVPRFDDVLLVGDRLYSVNGVRFDTWRDNLHVELLPRLAAGDLLHLEIEREGEIMARVWQIPGFSWDEFRYRALNNWWMGYFFWLAGLATLLLVRPYDLKRSLFAAFFYLTALWLVVGNASRWEVGESRVIYRMAMLLSVPVMLHLHWISPRPLAKLPGWLWGIVYAVAGAYALLHLTPYVAVGAAALAYACALMASAVLLFFHYWRQPEVRVQIRLLFYAVLFAIVPVLTVTMTVALRESNVVGTYGLLALPIIPGAYFFAIYRYQLGGIEFRANRLIAVYLYVILLGTLILVAGAMWHNIPNFDDSAVLWMALLGIAAAVITLYGFPVFQRVVDRRLLGMPLPPVKVLDTYLARITTTLSEPHLVQLLKDEVLPTLLVRQSALLHIHDQDARVLYSTGVPLPKELVASFVAQLQVQPIYRVPRLDESQPSTWVRLGLALQVEGKLIGIWLLGRHDPDDYFSPIDVATLQTLARQTALALANIEQANQLQALYQASIDRQELERMKMAHFLHDAILNSAAVMYMSIDAVALTPHVEDAYATLKEQIRQMISNLRPPSLDLGLDAALEEFASELELRAEHATAAAGLGPAPGAARPDNLQVKLHLNLPATPLAYPAHIENHLFRIVQQACENAFRHAQATTIEISGTLAPHHVELMVADDGVGFEIAKPLNMAALLAHKHFGLVHMMERAEHIHANLVLDSAPGQGTRVRLAWFDKGQANALLANGA